MADLRKRGGEFILLGEMRTTLELVQDRIARLAAHADDEGKTETLAIGAVQRLETLELRVAEAVQAETALLGDGFRRHRAGTGDLAAELGMAAQEGELRLARRLAHGLHHRLVERGHGREGAARGGSRRHPGRMFEDVAQGGGEGPGREAVQMVERNLVSHDVGLGDHAAAFKRQGSPH